MDDTLLSDYAHCHSQLKLRYTVQAVTLIELELRDILQSCNPELESCITIKLFQDGCGCPVVALSVEVGSHQGCRWGRKENNNKMKHTPHSDQCRCKVWKSTPFPDYTRVDSGLPRIYPGVVSRLYPGVDSGGSQNLPPPHRIYPLRGIVWNLPHRLWRPINLLARAFYTHSGKGTELEHKLDEMRRFNVIY